MVQGSDYRRHHSIFPGCNGAGLDRTPAQFYWSPLYTLYLGSFMLHFTTDPYIDHNSSPVDHRIRKHHSSARIHAQFDTAGHRLDGCCLVGVLPINFNALYEVHLFAVIPLLLSVLARALDSRANRAGESVPPACFHWDLMRNEYLVAAALFRFSALGWELLQHPREDLDFKRLGLAYGLPILVAALY